MTFAEQMAMLNSRALALGRTTPAQQRATALRGAEAEYGMTFNPLERRQAQQEIAQRFPTAPVQRGRDYVNRNTSPEATRIRTAPIRTTYAAPVAAPRAAPMQQRIPEPPPPPPDQVATTGKHNASGTQTIGDFDYRAEDTAGLQGMTSSGAYQGTEDGVQRRRRRADEMLGINMGIMSVGGPSVAGVNV